MLKELVPATKTITVVLLLTYHKRTKMPYFAGFDFPGLRTVMGAVRRNSCARIVLGTLVAGCWNTAAQNERPRARMEQVMADARVASRECREAVLTKPDYVELKTKLFMSLDTSEIPSQYLTDRSFPTKKQTADLFKLYGDLQACRKIMLDRVSTWHPFVIANMVELFVSTDKTRIEGISGKLSWGQYHQTMQDLVAQNKLRLTEDARTAANTQNQDQFAIEQHQRPAAAMQQWVYQQLLLNKNGQLPVITCSYLGATATCI